MGNLVFIKEELSDKRLFLLTTVKQIQKASLLLLEMQ